MFWTMHKLVCSGRCMYAIALWSLFSYIIHFDRKLIPLRTRTSSTYKYFTYWFTHMFFWPTQKIVLTHHLPNACFTSSTHQYVDFLLTLRTLTSVSWLWMGILASCSIWKKRPNIFDYQCASTCPQLLGQNAVAPINTYALPSSQTRILQYSKKKNFP